MNFIYVKDGDTIAKMINDGYKLLKVTDKNIYVFVSKQDNKQNFSNKKNCVASNKLTF